MLCGATIHISRNPDHIRFRLVIRPVVISSPVTSTDDFYLCKLALAKPRHVNHSMSAFYLEMRPDSTRMSSGSCTMGPCHLTDILSLICLLYRPKVCLKITFYVAFMI